MRVKGIRAKNWMKIKKVGAKLSQMKEFIKGTLILSRRTILIIIKLSKEI